MPDTQPVIQDGVAPPISSADSRVTTPVPSMLEHLKRLKELRDNLRDAGPLKKMGIAEEIGEESFKFALAVAREIATLKQEVAQWKPKS